MKLLALDTSSITTTVALLDGDRIMGEYSLNYRKDHSEKLMPMVEELLKGCKVKPREIDVFAVSLGPGSFTGLRIGIATMATMAQALGKKVVGVPTLKALAYNLYNIDGLICPIIDAQRDSVYTALYKWIDGEMVELMDQQIINIDDLVHILKEKKEKIYFVGDGLERFSQNLKDGLHRQFLIPPSKLIIPSASSVAEVAKIQMGKGIIMDIAPIYMRKSGAEVQYEKKMKGRE